MSYDELLRLPQWQRKRQLIIARDGGRCRHCGGRATLQVHHRQYHRLKTTGAFVAPWTYPAHLLLTLCATCHQKGHEHFKIPVFFI